MYGISIYLCVCVCVCLTELIGGLNVCSSSFIDGSGGSQAEFWKQRAIKNRHHYSLEVNNAKNVHAT